jgi:hypothetical protein
VCQRVVRGSHVGDKWQHQRQSDSGTFIFVVGWNCRVIHKLKFLLLRFFLCSIAYDHVCKQAYTSSHSSLTFSPRLNALNAGMWAVAFALLAFEACTSNEPERRFYCFPCMMPTKWSPLLLLVLFSVLMGASIDSYIGLALGTHF